MLGTESSRFVDGHVELSQEAGHGLRLDPTDSLDTGTPRKPSPSTGVDAESCSVGTALTAPAEDLRGMAKGRGPSTSIVSHTHMTSGRSGPRPCPGRRRQGRNTYPSLIQPPKRLTEPRRVLVAVRIGGSGQGRCGCVPRRCRTAILARNRISLQRARVQRYEAALTLLAETKSGLNEAAVDDDLGRRDERRSR